MKTAFAEALRNGPLTCPSVWGWGINWESRQLPIMPEWAPFVADFQLRQGFTLEKFVQQKIACPQHAALPDLGMTYVEMSHHIAQLSGLSQSPLVCLLSDGTDSCLRDALESLCVQHLLNFCRRHVV